MAMIAMTTSSSINVKPQRRSMMRVMMFSGSYHRRRLQSRNITPNPRPVNDFLRGLDRAGSFLGVEKGGCGRCNETTRPHNSLLQLQHRLLDEPLRDLQRLQQLRHVERRLAGARALLD